MLGVTVIGFVVADPGVHTNVLMPTARLPAVKSTVAPEGILVEGSAERVGTLGVRSVFKTGLV